MRDPNSHTEAVRPGTPVYIGSVILLPVERVVLRFARGGACAWISAAKEPYALIVRDPHGTWAIDPHAVPIALEALRAKVPGLDTALAAM